MQLKETVPVQEENKLSENELYAQIHICFEEQQDKFEEKREGW